MFLKYNELTRVQGTGTQAGDPVELEAIAKTFGMSRDSNILVGSAKSNVSKRILMNVRPSLKHGCRLVIWKLLLAWQV